MGVGFEPVSCRISPLPLDRGFHRNAQVHWPRAKGFESDDQRNAGDLHGLSRNLNCGARFWQPDIAPSCSRRAGEILESDLAVGDKLPGVVSQVDLPQLLGAPLVERDGLDVDSAGSD